MKPFPKSIKFFSAMLYACPRQEGAMRFAILYLKREGVI